MRTCFFQGTHIVAKKILLLRAFAKLDLWATVNARLLIYLFERFATEGRSLRYPVFIHAHRDRPIIVEILDNSELEA